MIDCENEVFTRVSDALETIFPSLHLNITSEYINAPSEFPHISIVMSDNYVMENALDSGNHEVSIVMFEVNIYSNKSDGGKAECRKLAEEIDNIMFSMNFKRLSMMPIPNMEDASIYRISARYRASTDGKFFYRR